MADGSGRQDALDAGAFLLLARGPAPLPPAPPVLLAPTDAGQAAGTLGRLAMRFGPVIALPLTLRGDAAVAQFLVEGRLDLRLEQSGANGQTMDLQRQGAAGPLGLWHDWSAVTTLWIEPVPHADGTSGLRLLDQDGRVVGEADRRSGVARLTPRRCRPPMQRPVRPHPEPAGAGQRVPPGGVGQVRQDGECDEDGNLGPSALGVRLPRDGTCQGEVGNSGFLSNNPAVQSIRTPGSPVREWPAGLRAMVADVD